MLSLSIRFCAAVSLTRQRVNLSAPCYDPTPPRVLGQGICSGEWINNITMYDTLRVPHAAARAARFAPQVAARSARDAKLP